MVARRCRPSPSRGGAATASRPGATTSLGGLRASESGVFGHDPSLWRGLRAHGSESSCRHRPRRAFRPRSSLPSLAWNAAALLRPPMSSRPARAHRPPARYDDSDEPVRPTPAKAIPPPAPAAPQPEPESASPAGSSPLSSARSSSPPAEQPEQREPPQPPRPRSPSPLPAPPPQKRRRPSEAQDAAPPPSSFSSPSTSSAPPKPPSSAPAKKAPKRKAPRIAHEDEDSVPKPPPPASADLSRASSGQGLKIKLALPAGPPSEGEVLQPVPPVEGPAPDSRPEDAPPPAAKAATPAAGNNQPPRKRPKVADVPTPSKPTLPAATGPSTKLPTAGVKKPPPVKVAPPPVKKEAPAAYFNSIGGIGALLGSVAPVRRVSFSLGAFRALLTDPPRRPQPAKPKDKPPPTRAAEPRPVEPPVFVPFFLLGLQTILINLNSCLLDRVAEFVTHEERIRNLQKQREDEHLALERASVSPPLPTYVYHSYCLFRL